MNTKQSEAIAEADAHLNNAGLPTYGGIIAALKFYYATSKPFAPLAEGGLGLPYVAEHLTGKAWADRQAQAEILVRAILAEVEGKA